MGNTNLEPFLLRPSTRKYLNGEGADSLTTALWLTRRLRPPFAGYYPAFGVVLTAAGFVALLYPALLAGLGLPSGPSHFWVIALAGFASAAACAVQSIRWRRTRTRLAAEGRVVPGRVLGTYGREEFLPPSQEAGTAGEWVFRLDVEYEFDAPSGNAIWAIDSTVRNELLGGIGLPGSGHPVLVLYLTDEHFVLL